MIETKKYRLHSMPAAQCHVVITTHHTECGRAFSVRLISYSTEVISLHFIPGTDGIYIKCFGLYSTTTARHINRFTTEFLGRSYYYDCKEMLKDTGERFIKFDYIYDRKGFYVNLYNSFIDTIDDYLSGEYSKRYYGSY